MGNPVKGKTRKLGNHFFLQFKTRKGEIWLKKKSVNEREKVEEKFS